MRKVTSHDVAYAVGVNQSTVSRALAGDPAISEATRQRVMEAARALNYTADARASGLRTGHTGTIAVVVICREGEDRKDLNPFTYALLGAVCAASSSKGYENLVAFQDAVPALSGFHESRGLADGLIVIGTTENRPLWDHYRALGSAGANWVCWGSPYDDLAWVRSDNHHGGWLAADHLIAGGCRSIACVGSASSPQRQFQERYEGYAERMRQEVREPWLVEIEEGLRREEQGRRAAEVILASGRPCDAIFAVCDAMALGILGALRSAGVAVPEGIALIGFDGTREGAYASPPLASIEPDFAAAGEVLVDRLLAVIAGDAIEHRRVPVRLLERESTRPPRVRA